MHIKTESLIPFMTRTERRWSRAKQDRAVMFGSVRLLTKKRIIMSIKEKIEQQILEEQKFYDAIMESIKGEAV